jgi:hypothetical protein
MEPDFADMAGRIRSLHGQLVILDVDLAALFGVMPEKLNAMVRERWSPVAKEFAFPVGLQEIGNLEPGLEDSGVGSARSTWLVYTEHGVLVAGDVLDDPHAVQQSIGLVRAFVAKRERAESEQRQEPRERLH